MSCGSKLMPTSILVVITITTSSSNMALMCFMIMLKFMWCWEFQTTGTQRLMITEWTAEWTGIVLAIHFSGVQVSEIPWYWNCIHNISLSFKFDRFWQWSCISLLHKTFKGKMHSCFVDRKWIWKEKYFTQVTIVNSTIKDSVPEITGELYHSTVNMWEQWQKDQIGIFSKKLSVLCSNCKTELFEILSKCLRQSLFCPKTWHQKLKLHMSNQIGLHLVISILWNVLIALTPG